MPGKRPNEPIGPTNVPGQRLDPKIPDDDVEDFDAREETEEEQQARESEKAFDQAITRIPSG
jgi:hypothetical protein